MALEEDDDDVAAADASWRAEHLTQGRRLLWAALAGVALMLLTIAGKSVPASVLMLVGWVVSFLAALSGISKVASAIHSNVALKYASFVLALMPPLSVIPLIYYLGRAQGALAQAREDAVKARAVVLARERDRRRAASKQAEPARPAAAASQRPAAALPTGSRTSAAGTTAPAATAQRLAGAVAMVKMAGLAGVSEGEALRASVTAPGMELPEQDLPIVRASGGTFGVMYAIDEGSQFSYVNRGDLQRAGMSVEDLHRVGLANLTAKVNDGKPGLTLLPQDGFQGLVMGGEFEASLVLLDALWDGPLKQFAPNGPVAALPARDICAFCDSASAEGIARLRDLCRKISEGDGRGLVSDKLVVRKNGRWQEFARDARAELAPLEFKL